MVSTALTNPAGMGASAESPLAQPAGKDQLLAFDHRHSCVQALGAGGEMVVAEKYSVTLDDCALKAEIKEGGRATADGSIEVHDKGGNPLAAKAQDRFDA